MDNKKLKLEKEKMLGFRLLDEELASDATSLGAKIGGKPSDEQQTVGSAQAKLGAKVGSKPAVGDSLDVKVGAKLGGKFGVKT